MTQEGMAITTAEALAVFEQITRIIRKLLLEGHRVRTPLVNFSSSMSGVFSSHEDRFDSARHTIKINTRAGARLQPKNGEIKVEIVTPRRQSPVPRHYFDLAGKAKNDLVTPGSAARLTDSFLKFNEEDANQGIFFIHTGDHTKTRVKAADVLRNKPGELLFINPELPPGTYKLEIRCIIHNNVKLSTGTLQHELTVPN